MRGRAYLRRQYHPDRLLTPLKRTGRRGNGEFIPISWDEALDTLAARFEQVKRQYGSSALFVPYGTGSYNQLNGSQVARRLMNLFGGCLGIYNSYSWAAISCATPTVYGTNVTGNQRQDWLNSKYILMWGWNPAEMRDGTNSDYFVKLAREAGARVVCIDPRHDPERRSPGRRMDPHPPGHRCGDDERHGVRDADRRALRCRLRAHSLRRLRRQSNAGAKARRVIAITFWVCATACPRPRSGPRRITAVPRATIASIAREYATIKPAVLYQGYGMQRRAYGEQVVRAGCVLAALTGNVGVPGGWASGLGLQAPDGGGLWTVFPTGENPVKAEIPVFLWTEAVLHGKELDRRTRRARR